MHYPFTQNIDKLLAVACGASGLACDPRAPQPPSGVPSSRINMYWMVDVGRTFPSFPPNQRA
jgi:hypothetical protein